MKFGITGNLQKTELPAIFDRLARRFADEKVPFVVHDLLNAGLRKKKKFTYSPQIRVANEHTLAASCDIVISLGGDGTILRTARMVGAKGTPILGINLGKLGFLAEVSIEELDACLTEILRGEYVTEERMMLLAHSSKLRHDFIALNDIVMDLSTSSRMISIETFVDGAYLSTFTGDGIIISTPTGSTGYALSNGGPIVTPTTHSIMLSPICPHTLTARSVIVPDESSIQLVVTTAPSRVHVTADGQPESLLKAPLTVTVKKAPFVTRLVKRLNTSYYDVLRKKLHWGKDVRMKTDDRP